MPGQPHLEFSGAPADGLAACLSLGRTTIRTGPASLLRRRFVGSMTLLATARPETLTLLPYSLFSELTEDGLTPVPALVLHGGADPRNDPSTSEGKEVFVTGGYTRHVPLGIGHFPQWETPEETARLRTLNGIHGKSVLTVMTRRSAALWDGIIAHAQIVENASDIAGELGDGGGDAVAALGLDQTGGEAAQACDVFRAVAGA